MLVPSIAKPLQLAPKEPTGPNLAYRADVDGLRAIAIIAVIAFHAVPQHVPGGFAGVDVFFVISGFLITGLLLRELEVNQFSLLHFYARRVRRLFPALILVLIVVWVFGWLMLLPHEYQRLGKHIAGGAGFALNLILYDAVGAYFATRDQPLTHLWSLGVEEQFYFFWPLFILILWKIGKRHFTWVVATVMAGSFLFNVAKIPWDALASFYLPWSRLWELALGGMLAHVEFSSRQRTPLAQPTAGGHLSSVVGRYSHHAKGLVGASMLVATFAGFDNIDFPGWWALIPAAGAALVISAGPHSWINRYVLSNSLMVLIGLISYPLYLWHWPLLAFTHLFDEDSVALTSGAITAASILAFLTYKYIELPVRHSKHAMTVAMLCGGMAASGALGFLTLNQTIQARPHSQVVKQIAQAASRNWATDTRDSWWTPNSETFFKFGAGPPYTLFIGDSFMYHYYPRIEKLLSHPSTGSRGVILAARGNCPPIPSESWSAIYGRAACSRHVQRAIERAENANVDTIVLSAFWTGYLQILQDGRYVNRPHTEESFDQLKQMILKFRRDSKRVYVVLQSPFSASFDPRRMIHRTILPPGFQVFYPVDPSRVEMNRFADVVNRHLIAIAQETGAVVIDPMQSLCDKAKCPAIAPNGDPIYRDSGHISPSYVRDHGQFMDQTILDGTEIPSHARSTRASHD